MKHSVNLCYYNSSVAEIMFNMVMLLNRGHNLLTPEHNVLHADNPNISCLDWDTD